MSSMSTIPGWLYLSIAIVAEVAATLALKASAGFTRLLPSIMVVAGYGVAFYLLSQTLKVMPVGVVYAIWSGMGIVLISLAGYFLYHQRLDVPAIAGILLIIVGVLVIQLFSQTSGH